MVCGWICLYICTYTCPHMYAYVHINTYNFWNNLLENINNAGVYFQTKISNKIVSHDQIFKIMPHRSDFKGKVGHCLCMHLTTITQHIYKSK